MSNEISTEVNSLVDGYAQPFAETLTQFKWDLLPDSQIIAAKQALSKNDYLIKIAKNNPESVRSALMNAAILGVDLTEGKRQGWLLPRKTQLKDSKGNYITAIVLQVGYKGVEAIHQRMGVIDRLSTRLVYENDDFEWSGDDQEKPVHTCKDFFDTKSRGKLKGAFIITYYPDKSINVTLADINDIYKKHRDASESYKTHIKKISENKYSFPPPWVTHEEEMIKKTMAYIAAKEWPANIRSDERSSKIVSTLHEVDVSDYSLEFTTAQKDAFLSFIDNDDDLGMFLFQDRVGIEGYVALTRMYTNQVARGQGRIPRRKKISDLVDCGRTIFDNIQEGIDTQDAGLVTESLEGVSDITMKLLKSQIGKDLDALEQLRLN